MLALVFLALQCHGLVEDSRIQVTKCNTDDGQPELTFNIEKEYFEQNLSWQADQVFFKVSIRIRFGLNLKFFKVYADRKCISKDRS